MYTSAPACLRSQMSLHSIGRNVNTVCSKRYIEFSLLQISDCDDQLLRHQLMLQQHVWIGSVDQNHQTRERHCANLRSFARAQRSPTRATRLWTGNEGCLHPASWLSSLRVDHVCVDLCSKPARRAQNPGSSNACNPRSGCRPSDRSTSYVRIAQENVGSEIIAQRHLSITPSCKFCHCSQATTLSTASAHGKLQHLTRV